LKPGKKFRLNRGFSRSNLTLGPGVGGLHEDFSDEFVEAEDEEHDGAEDVEELLVLDAISEGGGAEASEADGEELGEDSTDDDGLETVRGRHGDGDDLGLVTHFSGDEHQGEEDVSGLLSNLAAAQESLELGTDEDLFLVDITLMVVDTMSVGLGGINLFGFGLLSCALARYCSILFGMSGDGHRTVFDLSAIFLGRFSGLLRLFANFRFSVGNVRIVVRNSTFTIFGAGFSGIIASTTLFRRGIDRFVFVTSFFLISGGGGILGCITSFGIRMSFFYCYFGCNGVSSSHPSGVSTLTDGLVNSFRVAHVELVHEGSDTETDEEDSAEELGPEGGDDKGDSPSEAGSKEVHGGESNVGGDKGLASTEFDVGDHDQDEGLVTDFG